MLTGLAALATLAGSGSAGAQGADTRPNVVVIMTDDQRLADLRYMTRTRSVIGDRGVAFDKFYVSYPLCCPSRATYLTGQYAHNHKVLANSGPNGGYPAFSPTAAETLPVWLARAGYRTYHLGKYLNGYIESRAQGSPPGWTDWFGSIDPSTYMMWGYRLNEKGTHRTYGKPRNENPALYQADVYRDKAAAMVRQGAAGGPFFLSVAFLAPHSEDPNELPPGSANPRSAPRHRNRMSSEPLPKDRSYDEKDVSDKPSFIRARNRGGAVLDLYATRQFRARIESLLAVDEAVERIVGALRDAGELDNTYVIFTSDNGFFQGEHRVGSGKTLVYEPSTHVPLLIRGPGIPDGRRTKALAANVDLAATILDAADARAGRVLDGRSLLGYARKPSRRTDRPVLLESAAAGSDLDQDGTPPPPSARTSQQQPVPKYQAIRTRRYLWVEYENGERELYDMSRDPLQLVSRHTDARYKRARGALRRGLRTLRSCRGSACRKRIKRVPAPSR